MNQKEFTEILYKTGKFKTKKETKELVNLFLETLKENIEKEEKVQFNNFGTFRLVKSKINIYVPKKEKIVETNSINIKFKASDNIKKMLKKVGEKNE